MGIKYEGHHLKPVKSLESDTAEFEDLAWWIKRDRKKTL